MSNESGRNQVYVRSFPDGDRRLQVSTDGGTQPSLSGDGKEIFYRNGDRMMAVELRATAAGVELSQPRLLFERPYSYGAGITIANYDVTADGQRFLMVKDEADVGRLRMMLNWHPARRARPAPCPADVTARSRFRASSRRDGRLDRERH